MSIGCLLVPSLALASELSDRPELAGRAVALADERGLRVAEATREARDRGVRAGMTLREAVAYAPALVVLEPHPARVARASDALLEAASSVSPLIEDAAPGEVYLDLAGLEGLYSSPDDLERALLAAVPSGLGARAAIAEERFTAYAAARSTRAGTTVRIARGESAAFLAPCPAGWLPLDRDTLERLQLLGIETAGAFAALPRHAVEAQFGRAGGRAWLAASGEDPAPVRPRPFARERVIEQSQAQPPLVSKESLLLGAQQLLRRALRHPRCARRFVRLVRLRATTEDDRLWTRTHVLREPTGDRDRLWLVIRPVLEQADLPGPIAELELELGGLTAESGRQSGLFIDHTRRREQLDEMVRHLKVRFGQSPVAQVVEVEPWSRVPERRYGLMDYDP
jgi:nucleotidyltransferase/DNA polymerase involved in DNA repair